MRGHLRAARCPDRAALRSWALAGRRSLSAGAARRLALARACAPALAADAAGRTGPACAAPGRPAARDV